MNECTKNDDFGSQWKDTVASKSLVFRTNKTKQVSVPISLMVGLDATTVAAPREKKRRALDKKFIILINFWFL